MKKLLTFFAFSLLHNISGFSFDRNYFPIGFYENKGQIIDQYGNPNPTVKYLFTGNGFKVQLKKNSFSYEILKTVVTKRKVVLTNRKLISKYKLDDSCTIFSHRIDIELVGANPNPTITANEKSNDYDNYYTTGTQEEGVTYVYRYNKVVYKDIYPNIDLEFLIDIKNKQPFKYNFIVHPNGKLADIQLHYVGAKGINLNKNGNINIVSSNGNFEETIPNSYALETGKNISVHYLHLKNGLYGFNACNNNAKETLVIDPWCTYYGSNSYLDGCTDLITDFNNNVIVTGEVSSTTNIASVNAHQTLYGGGSGGQGGDAFLVKFNVSGNRLWGTYYGGSNLDYGSSVGVDYLDNIVLHGTTMSSNNIVTSGSFQSVYLGSPGPNGFIARFSSNGIRKWGTYYAGGLVSETNSYGMCLDSIGNIYVTGQSASVTNIATPGSFQSSLPSPDSAGGYIIKFDTSGNRIWGTYFLNVNCEGICLDNIGNVYIGGTVHSNVSGVTTSGSFQPVYGGGSSDYFLAKINPLGSQKLWCTYYGGNDEDDGLSTSVSTDNFSNVYLGGHTLSSNNISTTGAFQVSLIGSEAGLLVKFDSNGNRLWGTYFPGEVNSNNIDLNGYIYITGATNSTTGISTSGAYQPNLNGVSDSYIAKFNPSGSRLWGTYFGGNNSTIGEGAYAIDVDNIGNIDIVGNVLVPSSNISTTGAFQTTPTKIFIASFDNNGTLTPTPAITGNSVNAAQAVCTGVQPTQLTGSSPSGGSGIYGYLWLQSTTNATSGFTAATGANNNQNYQPPLLSVSTWYKRIVMSGSNADTTTAIQITVNAAPNASVTAGCATIFCQGGSVTLDATTGSGLSYQWQNNNANINGETNANYTATTTGVYQVVISANGCTATSNTITVTVNPVPTANVSAGGNTTFCQGGNVILNANIGTGFNYQWYIGSSAISGATNSSYVDTISGSFYVIVTNSSNCSDTSSAVTVTVNTFTTANVTASGNTSFCQGGNVILNANTGSGLSYQWYNGATAIIGATNSSYVDTVSGSFSVIVTNSSNCSDTSTAVTVTVNPLPSITITQNINTLNSSGSFNNYQWYYNNTAISGATTANYNPTQTGNYYLVVTDGNNCNGESNTISFVVGVEEVNDALLFSVSPNPFKECFVVNCPTGKGNLLIVDAVGKVVKSVVVKSVKTTIDTKGFASGVYLVKYENEGVIQTVKVVKE